MAQSGVSQFANYRILLAGTLPLIKRAKKRASIWKAVELGKNSRLQLPGVQRKRNWQLMANSEA